MRYYPESESDFKEVERMNAKPWQVEMLKKNPSYNSWGVYEDYMMKQGDGWDSRVIADTIEEGLWQLDELNELVNFYFEVRRESVNCVHCEQTGLNPETKQLHDDWYDFSRTGRRWDDKITQDEVNELVKQGRLRDLTDKPYLYEEENKTWTYLDKSKREWVEMEGEPVFPTAEEVNEWQRGKGFGHDAINRWICIETRAKRLGFYGNCEHCEGHGYVYTEPEAKLALQLWMLHPRKGCSRGVYIKEIKEHEIEHVLQHLKEARDRNTERFSKL